MPDSPTDAAPGGACYTLSDLSRYTRASENFWRREINCGRLRAFDFGGAGIRVFQRDLDAYLSTRLKTGPNPLRDPRRNPKWRSHGRRARG